MKSRLTTNKYHISFLLKNINTMCIGTGMYIYICTYDYTYAQKKTQLEKH